MFPAFRKTEILVVLIRETLELGQAERLRIEAYGAFDIVAHDRRFCEYCRSSPFSPWLRGQDPVRIAISEYASSAAPKLNTTARAGPRGKRSPLCRMPDASDREGRRRRTSEMPSGSSFSWSVIPGNEAGSNHIPSLPADSRTPIRTSMSSSGVVRAIFQSLAVYRGIVQAAPGPRRWRLPSSPWKMVGLEGSLPIDLRAKIPRRIDVSTPFKRGAPISRNDLQFPVVAVRGAVPFPVWLLPDPRISQ